MEFDLSKEMLGSTSVTLRCLTTTLTGVSMDKPLIFISHKTSDSKIATVIAKFIRDRSQNVVDIFLSSNWKFEGPRFGPGLNNELMTKLWNTDVLILVYTSADQDWSYCLWECGVASDSGSPNTRMIVFQCGIDVPTPFVSDLRVDVRNLEHIRRFTKQFLKDPGFLPSRGQALAPDIDQETVETAARELFTNLEEILPDIHDPVVEWPAWPFLRIELPQLEVKKLQKLDVANRTERMKLSQEVVTEHAIVVKSDARAAQLFGLNSLTDKLKFKELLQLWKERFPTVDATWFDSCCEQIRVGARMGFPVIWRNPMKAVGDDSEYTPVLSRVRRIPFGESVHFDLYFYNLSDPKAVLAISRMIPIEKFFYKNIEENTPDSIKLKELVDELRQSGLNRVPILTGERHPLYIVHRSMIDKFVAENIWNKSDKNPEDFTLADLLADPEMKEMFENTFVVISQQCSLAEAKSAMLARPGCSDVFVTENGKRDETVIGWLTNVDIAHNG